MGAEHYLENQLDLLKGKDPVLAGLVQQLIEYRAAITDNEINNRLLQELIAKYSLLLPPPLAPLGRRPGELGCTMALCRKPQGLRHFLKTDRSKQPTPSIARGHRWLHPKSVNGPGGEQ